MLNELKIRKAVNVNTYQLATKVSHIDQRHVCPGTVVAKLKRIGVISDTTDRELLSRR